MAEILIKAKSHWMENIDRSSWDQNELNKYARRTSVGSPIVIKPDNWNWGGKECPPQFIVLKLPGVEIKDIRKYLESEYTTINEQEPLEMLKQRKYQFPEDLVNEVIVAGEETITLQEMESLIIDRSGQIIIGVGEFDIQASGLQAKTIGDLRKL